MLIGEPAQTQFDVNFTLPGGIRVRISAFFWLAVLIIGWQMTQKISNGNLVPDATLILLWAGAMFLSILVHELGHVLAFRYYGIPSHIVLYHFGGLAIPDSFSSFSGFGGQRLDSKAQIVVSAAGPAAQLLLALLVILLVRSTGCLVTGTEAMGQQPFTIFTLDPAYLWGESPNRLSNPYINSLAFYILWPSIYWAILNLAPLYPLDGGQIAREALLLHDPYQGIKRSLFLSVATGAIVAVFALSRGQTMLGVMFGMLAFNSYQMLQQYSGRGGGFGGGGFGGGGGGFGGGRGW